MSEVVAGPWSVAAEIVTRDTTRWRRSSGGEGGGAGGGGQSMGSAGTNIGEGGGGDSKIPGCNRRRRT